jgi:hypothetical protein
MTTNGAPVLIARRVDRPGIAVVTDCTNVAANGAGAPTWRGYDVETGNQLLAEVLAVLAWYAAAEDAR